MMGRFITRLLVLLVVALGFSSRVSAQTPARAADAAVAGAQGSLEYTLDTLKDSVARLSGENRKLSSAIDQAGLKLRAMPDELAREQAQGEKTGMQIQSLEPRYQKKMAERAALERQLEQGVAEIEGIKRQQLAVEGAIQAKNVEDGALAAQAEALSRELKDIRTGLVPGEDHAAELEALRGQQQGAQKDLDAFTSELDRVRGEWRELAVSINAGPGQVDTLMKDQAALKSDLVRRTQEVDVLRQRSAAALKETEVVSAKFSAEVLVQLEQEVKGLEMKAAGLEKEVAEADKAGRSTRVSSASQEAKRKRDEARFKELLARNRDLTMGLKNLQRSMVSMDKKKAQLEKQLDDGRQY